MHKKQNKLTNHNDVPLVGPGPDFGNTPYIYIYIYFTPILRTVELYAGARCSVPLVIHV